MAYPGDVVTRATQFVRLLPVVLTPNTTTIASFGTLMELPIIDNEHPKKANMHQAKEYNTRALSGGDTLKHPKNTDAYNAADGSAAPKSDNADSLKVSVAVSWAHYKALSAIMDDTDQRIAGVIGYGRIASAGTCPGFLYQLGKPLGDLEFDIKDDFSFFELTIEGGEVLSEGSKTVSDFNTAMKTGAGTGNAMTLLDATTIAIPDLADTTAAPNWNNLLSGKQVQVNT